MTCCGSCGSKKKSISEEIDWGPQGFKTMNDDTFMIAAESEFAGWKDGYTQGCGCGCGCGGGAGRPGPSCDICARTIPADASPHGHQDLPSIPVYLRGDGELVTGDGSEREVFVTPVSKVPSCCCIKSVSVTTGPPKAKLRPLNREHVISVKQDAVILNWPGADCRHFFREYDAGHSALTGAELGNYTQFDSFGWNEPDGPIFDTEQNDLSTDPTSLNPFGTGADGSFDDRVSIVPGAEFSFLQYHEFRSGCQLPMCLNCKLLLWVSVSPAGVFKIRGKKNCEGAGGDGDGGGGAGDGSTIPGVNPRQGPVTAEDMKSPWVVLWGLAEWQVITPEEAFEGYGGNEIFVDTDGGTVVLG